jgi:glycosyltransferase involved in cell wall biosynthesis
MKLSFLTAIKDGFDDFRLTIPTVLTQSVRDFEWILVDDASAVPLAEAFPELARDSRIKIFRNEVGNGQTKSLNLGIQNASGDWIVRMDGDDLCAPDRLARIIEANASYPAAEGGSGQKCVTKAPCLNPSLNISKFKTILFAIPLPLFGESERMGRYEPFERIL